MYVCFISLIYGLVCLLNISLILIYYNGYISLNKGIILAYMAICFYVYRFNSYYISYIWVDIFIIDNCYHLDFMEQEMQIKKKLPFLLGSFILLFLYIYL